MKPNQQFSEGQSQEIMEFDFVKVLIQFNSSESEINSFDALFKKRK